jgi:hypothetical protein
MLYVLPLVCGWLGAVAVLVGYAKNWDKLHVGGSLLLGVYAAYARMWPQVFTNLLWVGVALHRLSRAAPERAELSRPAACAPGAGTAVPPD